MRRRGQTGFNLVTLLVQRGIKRRCEKYVFATDKTSLQIQDKFIWLKYLSSAETWVLPRIFQTTRSGEVHSQKKNRQSQQKRGLVSPGTVLRSTARSDRVGPSWTASRLSAAGQEVPPCRLAGPPDHHMPMHTATPPPAAPGGGGLPSPGTWPPATGTQGKAMPNEATLGGGGRPGHPAFPSRKLAWAGWPSRKLSGSGSTGQPVRVISH